MRAFIIGNGKSREGFNLDKLTDEVTFGCNALYRNWWPSYLVSMDDGMIEEIKRSYYPKDRFIEPAEEEKWEPAEVNPNRPRSNAGMIAMNEAIKRGYTDLYCLGFDFLLQDQDASVSNVYDGTLCYGPETRAKASDNPNRARFLIYTMKMNPKTRFNFILDRDIIIKSELIENMNHLTYKELEECFRQ